MPEALLRLRYSRLVGLFYAKYLPFRDTPSIKFLAPSRQPEAPLAAKPQRIGNRLQQPTNNRL
jgi:hypothetical protein